MYICNCGFSRTLVDEVRRTTERKREIERANERKGRQAHDLTAARHTRTEWDAQVARGYIAPEATREPPCQHPRQGDQGGNRERRERGGARARGGGEGTARGEGEGGGVKGGEEVERGEGRTEVRLPETADSHGGEREGGEKERERETERANTYDVTTQHASKAKADGH